MLKLFFEPEVFNGTEDELTTDTESETDAGKVSNKNGCNVFVTKIETEEPELVKQKVELLGDKYTTEVKNLFRSYHDVIAHSFDDFRPSKCKLEHKFDLMSYQLIFLRLRRLPPAHNETVRKEVERMLNAGIITPVESQWTSPIVLVTKTAVSISFFFNYCRLNAVMKRDSWPFPRVGDIFEEAQGSRVFTTIDLFQGDWQIKMEESCMEMTTFICKYGTYQFDVMPFGLRNSGATFLKIMHNILENTENVKCYVDDVVVYSATEEEHIAHLDKVVPRIR